MVRNSAGQVVRTLASDQAFTASSCNSNPPVSTLNWDFRDDGGSLVPDGDYAITVSATDTSNPSATAELTVTWHVSSLTTGEFVSPVPGQFVAGPETYEFHPTPGFTASYPLAIGKPRPASSTSCRSGTIPTSGRGTPRSARTAAATSSSLSSSWIPWVGSTSTTPSSR